MLSFALCYVSLQGIVSWSTETGRVGVSLLTLVMTGRGQVTILPGEGGDPASMRGHVLGPQVSPFSALSPSLAGQTRTALEKTGNSAHFFSQSAFKLR